MVVLNKKRLLIIFSMVCVSILVCNFKTPNKEETMSTAALPVTSKVIILDAGHGSPDNGASSADGVTENEINLKIVLKLQQLLEQGGSTVILTRSDENGIYELDKKTLREKKVSDLKNRVKIGNESDADIFVSVHLNKIPQSQYYGWQTFFRKNDENSKLLATLIQEDIKKVVQRENKREALSISDKYIVENVELPITIVECGFLSNAEEEALLQNDEYQNKLALGIYLGIIEYFNQKN